jgi:glycosyltransferase involved in cell wall biosynthesis
MRGGEAVLERLCARYPEAPIFTLVHAKGSVSEAIEAHPIVTSFVQHMPFAASRYRSYLPLFPAAIERFDLSAFDLVISSSHCVAKGARPRAGALHLSYCHTPMRYVWDQYDQYWAPGLAPAPIRAAMALAAPRLRRWDVASASRVSFFAANSRHVARRIRRHYDREAEVIHPPVETSAFAPGASPPGDYFLVVSAFAPYKRVDLAVEAFNRIGYPLKIVGSGPMESRLRAAAKPNVELLGWRDRSELSALYAGCRALIFPGEEDFGIVPVEAMAAGRPVIALGRGGALETVIAPGRASDPAPTGVFFEEQSVEGLLEGISRFEKHEAAFDPARIRERALAFDRAVFDRALGEWIDARVAAWRRAEGAAC